MTSNNNQISGKDESGLEEVHYRLNGALQTGPKMQIIICKTLLRLPQSVQDFVYENCMFCEVGLDTGLCISKNWPGPHDWLIVLGSDADESVIAHEIAHSLKGHKRERIWSEPDSNEVFVQESEACEIVKQWGFTGPGTEAET